jgi:hypothetical protein
LLVVTQNLFPTILKLALLDSRFKDLKGIQQVIRKDEKGYKNYYLTGLAPLQTGNSPLGLRHPLCGRFASLRMVPEKIFIRTQSNFFEFQDIFNFEI